MGYIIHDAIIATSFSRAYIDKARAKAVEIGLPVTEVVAAPINSYYSFLIATDGSKEGWSRSDEGDAQRAEWIEWTRTQWRLAVASEGGAFVEYAHIRYGGDCDRAEVAGELPDRASRSWVK